MRGSICRRMKRNEQKEIESRLLSQKNILSYILRETIKEFANMDLADIAQLIGDNIFISQKSAESGDYLSFRFYVQMKSGYSQILMNIEAEDSENQIEQDFLTQGIVQLCKLVASQNENNLIMSQFKNMLNTYCICIYFNIGQDFMNYFTITNQSLIGDYNWLYKHDLLNLILVGVDKKFQADIKKAAETDSGLHNALRIMFCDTLSFKEKVEQLEKSIHIPVNEQKV